MKQSNRVKRVFGMSVIALLNTLVACGGGSDEGAIGSVASSVNNLVISQPPLEPVVIRSTEDLVVTDSFLFKSHFDIELNVNVSADYDYLIVCYPTENDQPNYEDCLIRRELENGVATEELLLTNDTDQLLVVIWDYDDINTPLSRFWDRSLDGDLIQVSRN